jgi:hypothetical protein
MLVATAIAIIFIPLFFHLIQGLADRGRREPATAEEAGR